MNQKSKKPISIVLKSLLMTSVQYEENLDKIMNDSFSAEFATYGRMRIIPTKNLQGMIFGWNV